MTKLKDAKVKKSRVFLPDMTHDHYQFMKETDRKLGVWYAKFGMMRHPWWL